MNLNYIYLRQDEKPIKDIKKKSLTYSKKLLVHETHDAQVLQNKFYYLCLLHYINS